MITRDAVQGFIDGHKMAGHSKECVKGCTEKWLKEHPLYPSDEKNLERIISDLESYRH